MLVRVTEKLELRRRWSDDEEGIDALERARHLREEAAPILGGRPQIAPFERVPVEMVLRRQDSVSSHGFNGLTNQLRRLCN
ncbi:MAG TPA: hypothetical protein VHT95_03280 [Vicinamibacterales bacterium]|nr:hypothetical protein [Vicinamibacterales bacterium]